MTELCVSRRKAINDWFNREPPSDEVSSYDYERMRYELRPGDVLLIEGRSHVSKVIRTITQSPWTHAALYIGRFHDIDDNHLKKIIAGHLKKRENVRLVIEAVLGKGTIVTPLSFYRYSHIRICRPTGLSPEDAQLVIAYAVRALGSPYSVRKILDLARFLLPWSILPRRWASSLFHTSTGEIESGICSSLIAEAFASVQFPILPLLKPEEEGLRVIKRNPHLYTPKDFDYSPWFESSNVLRSTQKKKNPTIDVYHGLPMRFIMIMALSANQRIFRCAKNLANFFRASIKKSLRHLKTRRLQRPNKKGSLLMTTNIKSIWICLMTTPLLLTISSTASAFSVPQVFNKSIPETPLPE